MLRKRLYLYPEGDGGGTPDPVEPTEPTEPPAEPTIAELMAKITEIQTQSALDRQIAEKAEKEKKKAENALDLRNKELSALKNEKRQQLTAEEQLAEREAEIAQRESDLQRRSNITTVRNLFADFAFSETELDDNDISMLVDADEEITIARCEWFKTTLNNRIHKAEKAAIENYIKSTPQPPVGGKPTTDSSYESRYRKALQDKNNKLAIAIKREAYAKEGLVLR